MPGRGEGGEWGEVTSTSNCTDYQARRLNIRFSRKGEKGTQLVHTLNGTAIAISRALIALMGKRPTRRRFDRRASSAAAVGGQTAHRAAVTPTAAESTPHSDRSRRDESP